MSRKIAGYRLGEPLGRGGLGAVYLARDERLRYQVAVKVLARVPDRDPAFTGMLIRESWAAAAMDHPHIIPVYAAGEDDGTAYIVMRYARGGDARSLLRRLGPLPLEYAWRIIAQVASALDAAHAQGLIHRDVKPANILFDIADTAGRPPGRTGDRVPDHAYLADFGMGHVLPRGQAAAADQGTGALDYLAPEQIEGGVLDGRADLYALACASFELLCGTPPFGAEQGLTVMYEQLYAPPPVAAARRAGLPAAVDPVLATALAKDPADRYPSCGRFAAELRAALGLGSVLRAGPAPSHGRVPGLLAGAPVQTAPAAWTSTRPVPVAGELTWTTPEAEQLTQPVPVPVPGEFTPPASPPRVRHRLRPALAAAVAVVALAAVATGITLAQRPASGHPAAGAPAASPRTTPAASPPPSPPSLASRQAAALDALLISSATARTALHRAVGQVGTCTDVAGAISDLRNVMNQRTSEYGRASALPVSALPDGTKVRSALMTALSRSLKADQYYLTWARQQLASGCTPSGQSSAYNAAFSASQQADAAKEAFVRVWNPVAARYGQAQDSPGDI